MSSDSLEPKKLALIRILQILQEYSDYSHPLKQEDIIARLDSDYGIVIERKAIGRNLSLLKEAGFEIESDRRGSWLYREECDLLGCGFNDAELHMLIDGVLCSKYIAAHHSEDLIKRLCKLSNKYFKSHVKNIYTVEDWDKTDNKALFYNIELIDDAIENHRQIDVDYNKYGTDKSLHRTATLHLSPYQLILHNQRYYLMAFNEKWKHISFLRLDHMTNMSITDNAATPLRSIEGYENGIDYKELSTALPYMYTDSPEPITFIADSWAVDQIVDWFGNSARIENVPDTDTVRVTVKASPNAMECWALQYCSCVEVIQPEGLREKIKEKLLAAARKYDK